MCSLNLPDMSALSLMPVHIYITCVCTLLWLVACSFERETYEIDENDGPLKLRLRLDKSPPKEFNLQVHDLNNTANGE